MCGHRSSLGADILTYLVRYKLEEVVYNAESYWTEFFVAGILCERKQFLLIRAGLSVHSVLP